LRFIQTNEPGEDSFARRLEDFVVKARANEKFKREYLAMNLHDRDMMKIGEREGIAIGEKQGAQAKAVEAARNMLNLKVGTIEQVAQITGLSVEQVLQLQQKR
jgi:predicted transposase YdaD